MKSILLQALTLCACQAILATNTPINLINEQKLLVESVTMAEADDALRVPGNNNATYGPIAKAEQLMEIEELEIAPSPIPVYYFPSPFPSQSAVKSQRYNLRTVRLTSYNSNQMFFTLLRGSIPASKKNDISELEHLLATATLDITLSAEFPDSDVDDGQPQTYTIPLRTAAFHDRAHLSIRNTSGAYTDYFNVDGRNDILSDFTIPGIFVRKGMWTFEVVGKLGDGKCLFALSLTQYLEGGLR